MNRLLSNAAAVALLAAVPAAADSYAQLGYTAAGA